ncbi:MAG TPA: hypothetical protein DCE18_20415 [Syntrophobacteraceae bacterium]|nr:hypothetical protein [Syntrophobacteraceae bacterium]
MQLHFLTGQRAKCQGKLAAKPGAHRDQIPVYPRLFGQATFPGKIILGSDACMGVGRADDGLVSRDAGGLCRTVSGLQLRRG